MVRKCGFFDCNNQVEKGNSCQSCKERKENWVCSACRRKPEDISKLVVQDSLLRKKYLYEMVAVSRNQIPPQYHQLKTEFDKLLPQIKLSAEEKKLIQEIEKFLSELLAEKGGKQDHIDWLTFCPTCNSEFKNQLEENFEKNPEKKTLMNSIGKKEKKVMNFFQEKVAKTISAEEKDILENQAQEEFYKKIATNPDQNQPNQKGPNQQGPGQQPNQNNNNSAKIAQLQQEVNTLKQEINALKKLGKPSPSNYNTLQEKQRKLQEKEKELGKLSGKNNPPPSNNQTNNNPNLPLIIGSVVGGVGIICLIVALLVAKKKKKNIIYAYSK